MAVPGWLMASLGLTGFTGSPQTPPCGTAPCPPSLLEPHARPRLSKDSYTQAQPPWGPLRALKLQPWRPGAESRCVIMSSGEGQKKLWQRECQLPLATARLSALGSFQMPEARPALPRLSSLSGLFNVSLVGNGAQPPAPGGSP